MVPLAVMAAAALLGPSAGEGTSHEARLEVAFGTTSAGLLEASIEAASSSERGGSAAVVPVAAGQQPPPPPRLRLRLSPDTPVRAGAEEQAALHTFAQSAGTLQFVGRNAATGQDFIGNFTEISLLWQLHQRDGQLPLQQQPVASAASVSTTVRQYAENSRVVVFGVTVNGAPLLHTNRSGQLPVIGFPSVDVASTEKLGYAFWHGLWPDPVIGRNLSFPLRGAPSYHDGPLVFTAPEVAKGGPRLSVLLGPLSYPLTTVFGMAAASRPQNSSNAAAAQLYFGPSARVSQLPAGYNYSCVAVLGDGVTDSVRRYGLLLRRQARGGGGAGLTRTRATANNKLRDPLLQSLSAWTDNGAYYFWNAAGAKVLPPPGQILPAWLASLRRQGVNVSTLQLDGWWMAQSNSTPNSVLWPGDAWRDFLAATKGTALLLYKAFFSQHYDLFEQLGCSAVVSPQGAHYPGPGCARAFYSALFAAFKRIAPAFQAYRLHVPSITIRV
jgi:hypothetical protein